MILVCDIIVNIIGHVALSISDMIISYMIISYLIISYLIISYMISYMYNVWYQISYHGQYFTQFIALHCHTQHRWQQQQPHWVASYSLLPWSCSCWCAGAWSSQPLQWTPIMSHHPGAAPAVASHPDVHVIELLPLSGCVSAEALPRRQSSLKLC